MAFSQVNDYFNRSFVARFRHALRVRARTNVRVRVNAKVSAGATDSDNVELNTCRMSGLRLQKCFVCVCALFVKVKPACQHDLRHRTKSCKKL